MRKCPAVRYVPSDASSVCRGARGQLLRIDSA